MTFGGCAASASSRGSQPQPGPAGTTRCPRRQIPAPRWTTRLS